MEVLFARAEMRRRGDSLADAHGGFGAGRGSAGARWIRIAAVTLLACAAALASSAGAAAAPHWRFEHPLFDDPTELVELGQPGDLQFRPGSNNRALLMVSGGGVFPRMGVFTYDGREWTALAEVCGASDNRGLPSLARVAWAGTAEFWTITQPSPPRGGLGGESPNNGDGLGLCHFRDGQVVHSFSRSVSDPDTFFPLQAAACAGPSACWFGGPGADDPNPSGTRAGAFHVRWDGSSLSTVYAPQGRGVTDIAAFGGGFLESVRRDRSTDTAEPPALVEPEPVPALLHTITGPVFRNVEWFPNRDRDGNGQPDPGVPVDGTDLYALDVDGSEAWAVGGGAPAGGGGAPVPRGPIAVRLAGGEWQEINLDRNAFSATDRFADVAAIPGSDDAWVVVRPGTGDPTRGRATVARISPTGAVVERYTTPGADGIAAKIDCASPTDCWMATYRGVLYHYVDPAEPRPPRDVDPAFAEVIRNRPNEALPQTIPDAPPEDDSALFAPPPVELPQATPQQARAPGRCAPRAPLIKVLRSSVRDRGSLTLRVSISLRRRARVRLVGFRGKRQVGRTAMRTLKRGRHTLGMPVSRARFPTRLRFRTKELTRPKCRRGGAAPDRDTIVTGLAATWWTGGW